VQFQRTRIGGAYVVALDRISDDRGFFARAFSREECEAHGLEPDVVHANLSFNRHRGTVRGFHYQVPPASEAKLIRCIRGAMHNVVLDMRETSPTFLQHVAVELSAENRLAVYVPHGCANAIQTLSDDTELFYLVSAPYSPDHERGVRFDDPRLAVTWPLRVSEISDKDQSWPLLSDAPS
jgi:dTDP-4-dehydrorhamnose 3,5-epimerase